MCKGPVTQAPHQEIRVKTLRLILGDQLHRMHSWFKDVDPDVIYVMMEVRSETDYVTHHIQKVVGIFTAMRSFAQHLRGQGHTVCYIKINDEDNRQSLDANIKELVSQGGYQHVEYIEPDEWRVDAVLASLSDELGVHVSAVPSEHFYTDRTELTRFFEGKKTTIMESFYRMMRKKHNVLMQGGEPVGGRWNYDVENRKKWKGEPAIPAPSNIEQDVREIVDDLRTSGIATIGELNTTSFSWPTTYEQARHQLDWFIEHALPHFGNYQDAMVAGEDNAWSLFHSRLSFALNIKLITPQEVVDEVVAAYHRDPHRYPISAVEGFVRQILGWREFVRGLYWREMPGYASKNFFAHDRPLPKWYWTGETKMNCMRHAVSQSLNHAYAHHIHRLMVTGSFALMCGCDPDEVDKWYLGIYIDAFEWVEITNTRGMSQMADGGTVGTKPYVSSANYINKMSNYCGDCSYDHKKRSGEGACPLNSLYWHFHHRQRDKLEKNHRIGMVYRTLDRMKEEDRTSMFEHAEWVLENVDDL